MHSNSLHTNIILCQWIEIMETSRASKLKLYLQNCMTIAKRPKKMRNEQDRPMMLKQNTESVCLVMTLAESFMWILNLSWVHKLFSLEIIMFSTKSICINHGIIDARINPLESKCKFVAPRHNFAFQLRSL